MPTMGAFGLLTALAPTVVVPNGTTEFSGGAAAAPDDPGPARTSPVSVNSAAAATRDRAARLTRCTR